MNKLLVTAAFATALAAPAAIQAQALAPAVVAVVDLDKVTNDCNACKAAASSLRGQVTALQNRQKTLAAPLETEGKAIQAAVNALNGKEPDAALQARIKSWQTKRDQGAQEISRQEQQIQNNQRYVQRQIAEKLGPIYSSVMQKRGANLLVDVGSTLASAAALDVTAEVLASLNTAMPTLSTNAPATAAGTSKPQGR